MITQHHNVDNRRTVKHRDNIREPGGGGSQQATNRTLKPNGTRMTSLRHPRKVVHSHGSQRMATRRSKVGTANGITVIFRVTADIENAAGESRTVGVARRRVLLVPDRSGTASANGYCSSTKKRKCYGTSPIYICPTLSLDALNAPHRSRCFSRCWSLHKMAYSRRTAYIKHRHACW
jgi:hypothetical protein